MTSTAANNATGSVASTTGTAVADNVELHLPSVIGYEKVARRAAEAVAEQMEFTLERIEDIKTAVAEACMNAIEHGNDLDREVNVTVRMRIMPDKLEVRIADIGRQSVPDALPAPGSGDMRGWGLFFIKQLVDEMTLTRLPQGGNEITMVLYLARAAAPPSNGSGSAGKTEEAPPSDTSSSDASSSDATKPGAPPSNGAQVATPAPEPPVNQPVTSSNPGTVQPAEKKPPVVEPASKQPSAVQAVETKPDAAEPVMDSTGDASAQPDVLPAEDGTAGEQSSPES